MRLFYVGNLGPTAASHSTEHEYQRAFEYLGWTVDGMSEQNFMRALEEPRLHGHLYNRALDCDLVLHTMTQGRYPNASECLKLWDLCADKGIPTASVHLDLFYGLSSPKDRGPQRQDLPREHPMFRVAHVFTPDGGHDDLWKRDGVNHHWLPPGVSHTECIDVGRDGNGLMILPNALRDEPWLLELVERVVNGDYLVGFAGSDGYHPEWPHRPQLVAWLRETYGDRFVHIGGSSTPRVTHLALNRIFASVPVWVGDSCLTRPDFPYWSDRVPETWGRGGFLIHPGVDALNEHYGGPDFPTPGWDWVVGDWDALRREIDHYLAYPHQRGLMRESMAERTRAHDTYVNRVQTMMDVIGFAHEPVP